jgi:hypothetical protein
LQQILSLSLRLIAAHDLQDDPGDHEGEQEEYNVEDYGGDLHGELIRSYWFIDLTEDGKPISEPYQQEKAQRALNAAMTPTSVLT